MSTAKERKQELRVRLHNGYLKAQGYRNYGFTWNHITDQGSVWVIHLQSNKYNFSTNFLVRLVYGVCQSGPASSYEDKYIKYYQCHSYHPIKLESRREPRWWLLQEDISFLVEEFIDMIVDMIEPWFGETDREYSG